MLMQSSNPHPPGVDRLSSIKTPRDNTGEPPTFLQKQPKPHRGSRRVSSRSNDATPHHTHTNSSHGSGQHLLVGAGAGAAVGSGVGPGAGSSSPGGFSSSRTGAAGTTAVTAVTPHTPRKGRVSSAAGYRKSPAVVASTGSPVITMTMMPGFVREG